MCRLSNWCWKKLVAMSIYNSTEQINIEFKYREWFHLATRIHLMVSILIGSMHGISNEPVENRVFQRQEKGGNLFWSFQSSSVHLAKFNLKRFEILFRWFDTPNQFERKKFDWIDKDLVKPKQTSIKKLCLVYFFQNKNQPSSCDATENEYITFLHTIHTFCGFGICFKRCIASILNGQYRYSYLLTASHAILLFLSAQNCISLISSHFGRSHCTHSFKFSALCSVRIHLLDSR